MQYIASLVLRPTPFCLRWQ